MNEHAKIEEPELPAQTPPCDRCRRSPGPVRFLQPNGEKWCHLCEGKRRDTARHDRKHPKPTVKPKGVQSNRPWRKIGKLPEDEWVPGREFFVCFNPTWDRPYFVQVVQWVGKEGEMPPWPYLSNNDDRFVIEAFTHWAPMFDPPVD
jgi:hypothetical protein